VKSLSFLTYLLRGFSGLMKPHQDKISQSVIALMKTCPSEAVTTRKELLIATRHILATDFRNGFFKHADLLFNEAMLVGTGRLARDTLRPLGFSTLADLVHHVRSSLSLEQLHRVIHIFSRIIHDETLPTTIQATSVRLLLNLVDHIFHNQDPVESKGKVREGVGRNSKRTTGW
jgi:transformation/transcription domain-associated protein